MIELVETITFATTDSPIGKLTVAARGSKVCLVHFGPISKSVRAGLAAWYPDAKVEPGDDPGGVVSVLTRYFGGELTSLDEVEVELHGTPFQQRVWNALRSVAAGTTTSYAQLAGRVGAPAAVRAVGRRKRREPGRRRSTLPPNHRQQRQPHGIRRRAGAQALAARPRRGEAVVVLRWHPRPDFLRFQSLSPQRAQSTRSFLVCLTNHESHVVFSACSASSAVKSFDP